MSGIPVNALGKEAKALLSSLLNPEKIFPADNKLQRDWRGLAELCGIRGEHIRSFQSGDPTRNVLKAWREKNGAESTIEKLLSFLEQIDRYDVIDDITPSVEKDIQYYKSNPKEVCVEPVDSDDEDILTYDDYNRKIERKPLITYDAFVLFDDEDIDFATNIVNTLEGQHNMKLCVKGRDLLCGKLEHMSVIKLITERCRKVIVVLSTAFWESPTNNFFYTLAQLYGLEKSISKIIPCMDKPCVVPIKYRIYHTLIFTRSEKLFGNFWTKLFDSVKQTPAISNGSRVMSERNQNTVTEKSPEPTKPVNHVKFSTPNIPEESREEEDTNVSLKEENIPTKSVTDEHSLANDSNDNTVVVQELKKKRSFSKLFKKIINPKSNKREVEREISTGDGVILKNKSSKKKMVVAN